MSDNNYSFGTNQFYPNQGNYENVNGYGNGGILNSIGHGFGYIYKNRWFLMFIMLTIPILTFMIMAFSRKGIQSELGWTCLLLLLTICIFYYSINSRICILYQRLHSLYKNESLLQSCRLHLLSCVDISYHIHTKPTRGL